MDAGIVPSAEWAAYCGDLVPGTGATIEAAGPSFGSDAPSRRIASTRPWRSLRGRADPPRRPAGHGLHRIPVRHGRRPSTRTLPPLAPAVAPLALPTLPPTPLATRGVAATITASRVSSKAGWSSALERTGRPSAGRRTTTRARRTRTRTHVDGTSRAGLRPSSNPDHVIDPAFTFRGHCQPWQTAGQTRTWPPCRWPLPRVLVRAGWDPAVPVRARSTDPNWCSPTRREGSSRSASSS